MNRRVTQLRQPSDTGLERIMFSPNCEVKDSCAECSIVRKSKCFSIGLTILIICLMVLMLAGCGAEEWLRDLLTPAVPTPNPDSHYGQIILALQADIDEITNEECPDTELLWEKYETLLTFRTQEYFFKSMAYGHFTGDYDTNKFDGYAKMCGDIQKAMLNFFDESEVANTYLYHSQTAYRDYDDSNFDYELLAEYYPDIDAMWEKYIEALLGS